MKKSSGRPSRTHDRTSGEQTRPAQARPEKNRKWIGYAIAGVAVIILILLILPCHHRCCGARDTGTVAYLQVMSGMPSGKALKRAADAEKQSYTAGKKRQALKQETRRLTTARTDRKVPSDKDVLHGANTKKKDPVTPPDSPDRSGRMETAGRDTAKPVSRKDQEPEVKRYEKPKVIDFGTRIEIVPAPQK